jgi:tricarballylate dehydrogenase
LMPDLTDDEVSKSDFGTYTEEKFFDDMGRVTEYRTDPELCEILVTQSKDTMLWMHKKGVRFMPIWGRQAYKIDGMFKFWGGLTVEAWGGGPGLVEALTRIARNNKIAIAYKARALSLIADDDGVKGVRIKHEGKTKEVRAKNVVLAAGGFQANTEMRTRYLGPTWELAKIRGTRFNTGDGIKMALDIGAMPTGNWSGAHAVGWDRNAPEFGDLTVGDNFQKHSYPWGIMINANGERFVDEGADFRNYTYAKYGRVILMQPGQFAWQVFDNKIIPMLRDEYRIKRVTKVQADALEELCNKLEDVNSAKALETIKAYNKAVMTEVKFDPNIKDGRGTRGLAIPKSNWANTIDEPPFQAYAVTCGLTFSFGGLKVDSSARVMDTDGAPIPGLFAAGELVGGLFYFNYPGGTGLMNGAVFGRIAGTTAGQRAAQSQ